VKTERQALNNQHDLSRQNRNNIYNAVFGKWLTGLKIPLFDLKFDIEYYIFNIKF